ncbi:MAG: PIN domain-containing protein, partial [Vitreoscilla sp.]|nr:PIN domain-containing protein [Vitreoscilla sp.]
VRPGGTTRWLESRSRALVRDASGRAKVVVGSVLDSTELMEAMTLSHGLQMGDALIAATALEHGLPLLTGNVRHFAAIPSLLIEGFAV